MMRINRNQEINNKILLKWEPIIKNIIPEISDKNLKELIIYCEYDSQDSGSNLLLSLRIFSKLNMKGKTFLASEGPRVNIINDNDREEILIGGSEEILEVDSVDSEKFIISKYEDKIVNRLAAIINKKLERGETLIAYKIIDSISLISEKSGNNFLIRSRFNIL